MSNENQKKYRGSNGDLILTDTGVIIKRGMLKGEKTFPYNSIVSVQFKKASVLGEGYIQLTLMGSSGARESTINENSINFRWTRNRNELFAEAKEIIEQNILKTKSGGQQKNSELNDLEKLAELKQKGVITEEEFNAKKKQILGL